MKKTKSHENHKGKASASRNINNIYIYIFIYLYILINICAHIIYTLFKLHVQQRSAHHSEEEEVACLPMQEHHTRKGLGQQEILIAAY